MATTEPLLCGRTARYQITPRVWAALSAEYGSGLPLDIGGDIDIPALTAEYGTQIIDRVNFSAARVRPNFSLDICCRRRSMEARTFRACVQGQISNLTNKLTLINFAGLFSGTAVAPPRSANAGLQFEF